jgi:outer membrane lipoprotein LolB
MIELKIAARLARIRVPRRARAAFLATLVLAIVLAGCAQAPSRPRVVGDENVQAAREAELATQPDWSFTGRVAVSSNGNAGNARIDWAQRGEDYDIRLSAPITRQSWRLRKEGARVSLEGLEGGTRQGADAEAMLREATGWRIPVPALASWVRGARAPGPADLEFDTAGHPALLSQAGWAVEYRGWTAASPPLPNRVFAREGEASVRLVVERGGTP